MIALPALATFVLALDQLQDIGDSTKYAGIIVTVNVLLGALLGASSRHYGGAGDLIVAQDATDGQVYTQVDYKNHPKGLKNGQNITLNVKRVAA